MSSRGTFVPYLNPLKHWKPPPRFTQITKNKGTCFFGTHRFGSFQPSCNWTSSQSWEMQHDSLIACRWQDLYLFFYDSTASSGTWTKNLKETSVRWLFWVVTIWVWSLSWVSTMELLEEAEKHRYSKSVSTKPLQSFIAKLFKRITLWGVTFTNKQFIDIMWSPPKKKRKKTHYTHIKTYQNHPEIFGVLAFYCCCCCCWLIEGQCSSILSWSQKKPRVWPRQDFINNYIDIISKRC